LQTALAATPARILYGPPAAVTALVHKVATLAGAGSRSAAPHLVPSPSRSASMTHVT
jgi:hypothetical protein